MAKKQGKTQADVACALAIDDYSGRAWLEAIREHYTGGRPVSELDAGDYARSPARAVDKALECLANGDVDKALGYAMYAAWRHGMAGQVEIQRLLLPLADRETARREAQARQHRADPAKLDEAFEKVAEFRNKYPGCKKTTAAKWAATQVDGVKFRTILKHLPPYLQE